MIAEFHAYLRSHADFSDNDLETISAAAIQKTLRRNDALFFEGEVCRHKTFITKGLLYTFATKPDGSEHILQFSPEHTWVVDAESYDKQIPSRYSISAVEESAVLLWSKADFDRLLDEMPLLKTLSGQIISRAIHSTRDRLLTALSATPEEKYNDFIRDASALAKRLPLRMIAAYLGISLKTLTRLRHAQIHR